MEVSMDYFSLSGLDKEAASKALTLYFAREMVTLLMISLKRKTYPISRCRAQEAAKKQCAISAGYRYKL
jgi:hypothetical protein